MFSDDVAELVVDEDDENDAIHPLLSIRKRKRRKYLLLPPP